MTKTFRSFFSVFLIASVGALSTMPSAHARIPGSAVKMGGRFLQGLFTGGALVYGGTETAKAVGNECTRLVRNHNTDNDVYAQLLSHSSSKNTSYLRQLQSMDAARFNYNAYKKGCQSLDGYLSPKVDSRAQNQYYRSNY